MTTPRDSSDAPATSEEHNTSMLQCCYEDCTEIVEPNEVVVCGDSEVGCGRWFCTRHLSAHITLNTASIHVTPPWLCPDCRATVEDEPDE